MFESLRSGDLGDFGLLHKSVLAAALFQDPDGLCAQVVSEVTVGPGRRLPDAQTQPAK